MDDRGGGSFVAVRRISQSLERGNVYHSSSSGNFPSLPVVHYYDDLLKTSRAHIHDDYQQRG